MDEMTQAAEDQWAKEQSYPNWKVVITGPDTEWVARSGVNEDEDGVPQPWTAPARAEVQLKAPNEGVARAKALADNSDSGYDAVESCEQI